MQACYFLSSDKFDCLRELRKYLLVVNCRINDGIIELGINPESIKIATLRGEKLLDSPNVEPEIKDMYNNSPCPGVSSIFKTDAQQWAMLLNVEVNRWAKLIILFLKKKTKLHSLNLILLAVLFLQHDDSIIIVLPKKQGDYVFVAGEFTSSFRRYWARLDGCELQWLDLDSLNDNEMIIILNSNKSYFTAYTKLVNSCLLRRKDKCISLLRGNRG